MLPGLRTLAVAVMLTFAIVTFAFGAAALLRVAHEDFAVLQTWRPAMEALTETVAAKEPEVPVLAALRVEPEPEATEQIVPDKPLAAPEPPPEPAPAEVTVAPAAPAEAPTEVVAALPQPQFVLPDAPYNEPLVGPRLMPEIATNDAPPVAPPPVAAIVVSVAPATQEAELPAVEPLAFAPLPRARPVPQLVKPASPKRIVRQSPARRTASRPAAQQTQGPLQQLFNSAN